MCTKQKERKKVDTRCDINMNDNIIFEIFFPWVYLAVSYVLGKVDVFAIAMRNEESKAHGSVPMLRRRLSTMLPFPTRDFSALSPNAPASSPRINHHSIPVLTAV